MQRGNIAWLHVWEVRHLSLFSVQQITTLILIGKGEKKIKNQA